jgi:hypothetical protein
MKAREIDLGYRPRPWQEEVHRTRRRFTVAVVHRRGGKSEAAIAELVDTALRKAGSLLAYVGPTRAQAKSVLWQRLKDFVRPVPGVAFFEQELRITFPNGSAVFLAGALDGADGLRGVGLDGAVLDEFALMSDEVFPSVIRPALADRQGWAIFIGTPKGRDPLYRLIQKTRGLPDWSHFVFRASETNVLPPEELTAARATMPEDAYQREFECSFEAAPPGSIFGRQLEQLRGAGRILPSIPFLDGIETWASLDLGIADATSAWIGQHVGAEVRLLAYREWTGTGLADTGKALRDLGVRTIYAPHDIRNRELVSGRSRREALESLGFHVEIASRCDVEEGIAVAAALLPHCVFDEEFCAQGLDRLAMYRRDTDDRHGGYGPPLHDINSHAADAFRYLALCLSDRSSPVFQDPTTGRVYEEPRTLTVHSHSGVHTITTRSNRYE